MKELKECKDPLSYYQHIHLVDQQKQILIDIDISNESFINHLYDHKDFKVI